MNINNLMAFAGGVLVGFGTAYLALEDRFGEKYAEMANANKRAYEMASSMRAVDEIDHNEVAVSEPSWADHTGEIVREIKEMKLHSVSLDSTPNIFGGTIEINAESVKNDYHKAIEAVETPHETFISGGVNDYGVSYLEEEEYHTENGWDKLQIDIMMNDDNPIFLMDGQPIDDWAERVGDSILLDMFKLCPPGAPPILYVRNHKDEVDYEVVRVEP